MNFKIIFVTPAVYTMLVLLMLAIVVFPAQCIAESLYRFATTGPTQLAVEAKSGSEMKSGQAPFRSSEIKNCSLHTWFFKNGTNYQCGGSVGARVKCPENEDGNVRVLPCYCITYDSKNQSLLLGGCLYTCLEHDSYYNLPHCPSQLNENLCAKYYRMGQLCGKCIDDFAPAVYSYNMSCINCTEYHKNWSKFILYSFVPLTGFFFVVIMFRISATSGLMNAFILITQVLTSPVLMRGLQQMSRQRSKLPLLVLSSIYGIWNLDFFRLFYSPFCLHPKMSMLQALALDYVIAVFPLVLIVVTYILVELHDKFRILARLWRPFHWCFVHFRRRWHIRASLIDALATFLLLSYVKFLNVSYDLLSPLWVYNIHGHSLRRPYLFYDGTVEYFGKQHLPYAILALGVLLTFNIFPILLFCLYPCCCFQRCLASLNLRTHALHVFMDAFQGCYKDGTNGTRDRRWFSVVYLVMRFVFLLTGIISFSEFSLTIGVFINLVVLVMLTIFQPYKSHAHTIIDALLICAFAFMFLSGAACAIAESIDLQFRGFPDVMLGLSLIIPLGYFIGITMYKLLGHKKWMEINKKIQSCVLCRYAANKMTHTGSEESLPDRLTHPEEYETYSSESEKSEDEDFDYRVPTEQTYLLGL